jgi:hypothetical protein
MVLICQFRQAGFLLNKGMTRLTGQSASDNFFSEAENSLK